MTMVSKESFSKIVMIFYRLSLAMDTLQRNLFMLQHLMSDVEDGQRLKD